MSEIDWAKHPEATHFDPVDHNFLREVGHALLIFNVKLGWTVPIHTLYGVTITDCHRPLIRRPEWDGEGPPPVGTLCEVLWNESRSEYLKTKIFGINEHGQPIHRFEEGPKKYQYQADVLRTVSGTQVFRPLKTPEQIAMEKREAAIRAMVEVLGATPETLDQISKICGALYDANYRQQQTS